MFGKVVRAAPDTANCRDGCLVVIGGEAAGDRLNSVGMARRDLYYFCYKSRHFNAPIGERGEPQSCSCK